ncbi:hypothetical protein D3C85_1010310 [compost metagenome]
MRQAQPIRIFQRAAKVGRKSNAQKQGGIQFGSTGNDTLFQTMHGFKNQRQHTPLNNCLWVDVLRTDGLHSCE